METINNTNTVSSEQSAVSSNTETPPPEVTPVKMEKSLVQRLVNFPALMIKKPLLGLMVVMLTILFLLLIVVAFKPRKTAPIISQPRPSTTPPATTSALKVSETGKSPEFAQLEKAVGDRQKALENIQFSEPRLQLPLLELQQIPKR